MKCRKLQKCKMLGELVELLKVDSANSIVERKSIKNDNFVYQHFKCKGYTRLEFWFGQWKKITYDENSTNRFEVIERYETELKWT